MLHLRRRADVKQQVEMTIYLPEKNRKDKIY